MELWFYGWCGCLQNLLGKIKSENSYIIKTIKTIENHLVDEIDKDLEEKSYDEQDLDLF